MFTHQPQRKFMGGSVELHAPLWVDGRFRKANYAGPGTDLINRLKQGSKPISGVDKVAMAHDLRYQLADGDAEAERKADEKMVSKLKEKGLDNKFNRMMGSVPIRAKMALENLGIFPKGHMSKSGPMDEEDASLVKANLSLLEQDGFGRPGYKLRQMARLRGCGNFPDPPADLQDVTTPQMKDAIREAALALNMPERIDEWIRKQSHYLWLKQNGVPDEAAIQEAFGNERPWDLVVNRGDAAERVNQQMMDVDRSQPAPKRRPVVSKKEFLERMEKGRAKAKRKRAASKKATKKTAKKRKMAPTKRLKMTTKIRAMLKRYGRGLVLAGAGSPDTFSIPEDMGEDELPAHVGGALKSLYNVEAPASFMASLGDVMKGSGDWDQLEEMLSGVKQV